MYCIRLHLAIELLLDGHEVAGVGRGWKSAWFDTGNHRAGQIFIKRSSGNPLLADHLLIRGIHMQSWEQVLSMA